MIYALISVKPSGGKGLGVFADAHIPAGTAIEETPVIVMTKQEREHLDKTRLHDYIFEWGSDKDQCCMALGFVPLYNHSYKSNSEYFMDYGDDSMTITAVRDIAAGEEITINYNGDWNDETPVWFDVAED